MACSRAWARTPVGRSAFPLVSMISTVVTTGGSGTLQNGTVPFTTQYRPVGQNATVPFSSTAELGGFGLAPLILAPRPSLGRTGSGVPGLERGDGRGGGEEGAAGRSRSRRSGRGGGGGRGGGDAIRHRHRRRRVDAEL